MTRAKRAAPYNSMSAAPKFEVIHCTTPDDIQRCVAIRMEVFVKEQGFTVEDEMDG